MTLYRNEGTPIGMNDCVAARLRFNHYGLKHVSKLVTSGVNTGLQLSQSTLVACSPMCDGSACSLTKARAPNRGAPKDPERRRATANFNHVATDVCGPISPSSSGGLRSDNESVFVQGKFRAFCNLHGITQETCALYQHWSNGHAESSFNATFAAARPMMSTSDFIPPAPLL
jgi:hypothetical protein